MKFRKNVPSLTALVALEAVVRQRSVTLAARELGVTQAAVSRQIAVLEADLGFPLFIRKHRALEPTVACTALAATLEESFSAIAHGVEQVRTSAKREVVTIGATLAFSTLWLLPRMAEFRRMHPGVQIRVVSQDSRLSLDRNEVDIVIRYGIPPFTDGTVLASQSDTIFPVCSPDYAAEILPDALWSGSHELIETDFAERGWYTWREWLQKAGRKENVVRTSLRFSHYMETISAARAGQGLALGWGVLVESFLEDGSLVKVGDLAVVPEGTHNIVVPTKRKSNDLRDLTAHWMVAALTA